MLSALAILASVEEESSKTAFYILGGLLAGWAVVLAVVGMRTAEFPSSDGQARGVMGLSVVLVVAALAAVVLTS